MLLIIYVVGIIIITCIIIYTYIYYDSRYIIELEKIKYLELKKRIRDNELSEIRKLTKACPVENLNNPRKCYFDSNYKCSWNEKAERCDLIEQELKN